MKVDQWQNRGYKSLSSGKMIKSKNECWIISLVKRMSCWDNNSKNTINWDKKWPEYNRK